TCCDAAMSASFSPGAQASVYSRPMMVTSSRSMGILLRFVDDRIRVGDAREHVVDAITRRDQHVAQLQVLGLAPRQPLIQRAVFGFGTNGKRALVSLDLFKQRLPLRFGSLDDGIVFGSGGFGKLNQLLY